MSRMSLRSANAKDESFESRKPVLRRNPSKDDNTVTIGEVDARKPLAET
jgi:hypothetical protein